MRDLLIRGGTVVDGTGAPGRRADVLVRDGNIAAVGPTAQSANLFDAFGLCIAPGFIDTHGHSDLALLRGEVVAAKVGQGVTTEILGQDGLSYAPHTPARLAEEIDYLAGLNGRPTRPIVTNGWPAFVDLYRGGAQNVALLVPYGAVRVEAAGWVDRPLDEAEIDGVREVVGACLEEGAVGVGLGLDYFPQRRASTAELRSLAELVAAHDAVLVAHVRGRDLGMGPAVRELMELGRVTGAKVHVSHLRSGEGLAAVDAALAEGIDVTFDVYPYTKASSMLTMHLPTWMHAGGPRDLRLRLADPDDREQLRPELAARLGPFTADMTIAHLGSSEHLDLVGHSLATAVERLGGDLVGAVAELLLANDLAVGYVGQSVTEEELTACVAHPAAMGSSDAILVGQRPHPRGFGSFPRFFQRYVRELGVISLERCVAMLAGVPARRFQLGPRGTIALGKAADLVIFDPATIADAATYESPRAMPLGIVAVLTRGEVIWGRGSVEEPHSGDIIERGR